MSDPTTYPKRPGHFAHKFCRLLAKGTVANELGAETCWLLTVIAHTEDAKGYRGPVLFKNGQLMTFCGFGSEKTLERVREKAVSGGWLHYVPGRRGVAPRYWVLIPPEHLGKDDLPSDERPDKYEVAEPANPELQRPKTGGQSGGETGPNATAESAHPARAESQAPTAVGQTGAKRGANGGQSGGETGPNATALSSLHLDLHQDQDERQVSSAPAEPFDPLKADEAARKLFEQRWNTSGLRPLKRLSHYLHSRLKALLGDADWARDYPAALERAGNIPWLRDGTGRKRGAYDVSEFLANDDEVRKLLAGVYDPHEAKTDTTRPHHDAHHSGADAPGGGHRIGAPAGKYARPAGDGLQTRRPPGAAAGGPAEPPAGPGAAAPGPADGVPGTDAGAAALAPIPLEPRAGDGQDERGARAA